MIEAIAMVVWGNMTLVQPDLAIFYPCKRIAQIGFAIAHRFDFSALQLDACLKNFNDFVFMTSTAIVGHDLKWLTLAIHRSGGILFH
jgi:hypothetical protein